VPEADASFFQREADAGRAIVAVGAGNRQQEATSILARYGGYGATARASTDYTSTAGTTVDTTAQTPAQAVVTDVDTTTQAPARDVVTDTEGEQRLQLREEELRARKQPVEAGEVHLRKDVVTEEQTLNVPVSREEVYIERRPASGEVSDAPIDEGETIEVPVREEQVQVEKQAVVREEIGLGKRKVQENQQVRDTVRREKARIEREGDVTVRGDTDVVDTTRGERTRLEREGDTDVNDVTS